MKTYGLIHTLQWSVKFTFGSLTMELFRKKNQSDDELFQKMEKEQESGTKRKVKDSSVARSLDNLLETSAEGYSRSRRRSEQLNVHEDDVPTARDKLEIPPVAYNVETLLRECNFRQKLNAEKRILREMANPQTRARQIAANKEAVAEIYRRANQRNSPLFGTLQLPFKPSKSMNSKEEMKGAMNDGSWSSGIHNGSFEDVQRDRAHTMPSYSSREKYPPSYWLTCTYRFLAEKTSLHLVVRQTGTLPKLRGKLSAKVFIDREKQVHKMVLAESSSDVSFRSQEFVLQCMNEPVGKMLVFRLYDVRHTFNKKCIGEWRIVLDKCTEKPKIECEKFR